MILINTIYIKINKKYFFLSKVREMATYKSLLISISKVLYNYDFQHLLWKFPILRNYILLTSWHIIGAWKTRFHNFITLNSFLVRRIWDMRWKIEAMQEKDIHAPPLKKRTWELYFFLFIGIVWFFLHAGNKPIFNRKKGCTQRVWRELFTQFILLLKTY